MKIDQIIIENLSWPDVQAKFAQNTLLLQFIARAGQDPRNKDPETGQIDWGAAVDLGNAEYTAFQNQQRIKATSQDDTPGKGQSTADTKQEKQWSSNFRGNQYTGGISGNAQDKVPGLRDLPKVDTSTIAKSASTSYQLGKGLVGIGQKPMSYRGPQSMKISASKKNPNKKL